MAFQYKRVLLVGATAGIGAAMADKLVEEGSKVIAVGRRQDRLDAFVQKHGSSVASGVRFDTTDKAGMDTFVNKTIQDYPDLDCVFLNSGTQSQVRLSRPGEVDLEAFHSEINTNFTSIVDLSLKFLHYLQQKSHPTGLIITGTHLAIIPAVSIPAYSASKAALNAFIYCLRAQNAAKPTKIIELWPPVVQTELHDYMGEERGRAMGMPVNEFVDKAYAGLVSGTDHVIIGSVGPEDAFLDIAHKRRQQFDNLSKFMLQHFEL